MQFELHPMLSIPSESFNVLIAPVETLVEALNDHLELQRFRVIYVCGNYSRILSGLHRDFTEIDVRRAFTAFQLMTILRENHHSFLIVEHDPMLYEDAEQMVYYVSQAYRQTSNEATILLYSPALDPSLKMIKEVADQVVYINEVQTRGRAKSNLKLPGAQATLGAF